MKTALNIWLGKAFIGHFRWLRELNGAFHFDSWWWFAAALVISSFSITFFAALFCCFVLFILDNYLLSILLFLYLKSINSSFVGFGWEKD